MKVGAWVLTTRAICGAHLIRRLAQMGTDLQDNVNTSIGKQWNQGLLGAQQLSPISILSDQTKVRPCLGPLPSQSRCHDQAPSCSMRPATVKTSKAIGTQMHGLMPQMQGQIRNAKAARAGARRRSRSR